MEATGKDRSYFSAICVETCGGICCDPWWGIISYQVVKEGGLSSLSSFRAELVKGLRARAGRITDAYVTTEAPSRALFTAPEKYNAQVSGIRASGTTLSIGIVAMYAFRCAFVSADRSCSIHPSVLGEEVRPPHCGFLGTPEAGPGEKGHCRIIHAALSGDEGNIRRALDVERQTAARSLREGVETPEEAADMVIGRIKAWCEASAPALLPAPSAPQSGPGRNDPCWCGSSKKFKKCHGR